VSENSDEKNKKQSSKKRNEKDRYKKHKTYLINEKKKKESNKDSEYEGSESEEEMVDLLSQKSMSSDYSDGLGSFTNFDTQKKNTNTNENKNMDSEGQLMNWELVEDFSKYNDLLQLDDEHCPMAKNLPQDKYANYEAVDIFNLFFNNELIKYICDSSNEFLEKERATFRFVTIRKHRKKDYDDVTPNEFRVFLGMKIFFNYLNNNKCKGKNKSYYIL